MFPDKEKRIDRLKQVDDWIIDFSESGIIGGMDHKLLKSVFIDLGAKSEIDDNDKKSLSNYSNKSKREGIDSVWGSDRYKEFKSWALRWSEDYESRGNKLPRLERSGSEISGMLQFFGELTSFAYGTLSYRNLKEHLEVRYLNGKLFQEGRKKDRARILVSTSPKPILISSFPPEFPKFAWEMIKTWEN